ncbi:endonuclease domain-containing protein [Thiohalobacter thiocyanaticus]|uniref:Endonuclease domain-containing protein n=1 Tax=Thiohalobacter thiocyanaticus TaxID=585455 RepID=A0A426QMI1_9GAMM|nr:endonuclease domain-containing protein [Thiohalobacter thiocyanaticus]RRQ22975.1 endonuclease domain-containing protein [Thiohalobacter thiocyanaticus]
MSIKGGRDEGTTGTRLNHARQLRSEQIPAEQRLWYHLRDRRFPGFKFRRQKPIGSYIVDFVCMPLRLVVEIDGSQRTEQKTYDDRRDAWLRSQGFVVLRFWNNEVLHDTAAVLERIRQVINALTPDPSPGSGRGE